MQISDKGIQTHHEKMSPSLVQFCKLQKFYQQCGFKRRELCVPCERKDGEKENEVYLMNQPID